MEDNDIAAFGAETYNVVVLDPTLVYREPSTTTRRWAERMGLYRWQADVVAKVVASYRFNELMGRWIHQQGYMYSIKTAVWGFGEREVFDALIERIGRLYGRYIFRFEWFEREEDARAALVADGSIHSVYDADEDRLERLWGMRGHRVTPGGAP